MFFDKQPEMGAYVISDDVTLHVNATPLTAEDRLHANKDFFSN